MEIPGHEESLVEAAGVGGRVRLVLLQHGLVEPADRHTGNLGHGQKVLLVLRHVLALAPRDDVEPLPDGRADAQEDGQGHKVHQAAEHPLLELELPEEVELLPEPLGHEELAEDDEVDVVPEAPDDLPQEDPERPEVAVLLHQQLQEDGGQGSRRLLRCGLEHHPQHGHVVRVPGVGEFVEDGVFEEGGEVAGVGGAEVLDAGQEQVDVGLGLEPEFGEEDHYLHVHGGVGHTVKGHAAEQLLGRAGDLGVHHPHLEAGGGHLPHLAAPAGVRQEPDEVPGDVLRALPLLPPGQLVPHNLDHDHLDPLLHPPVPLHQPGPIALHHPGVHLDHLPVDGQLYDLYLVIRPCWSPAARAGATGGRGGAGRAHLALPGHARGQHRVERSQDVVGEELALLLVHPEPLAHRVLHVDPEEGLWPGGQVLEGGVQHVGRHHGDEAVALGLEALPDVPLEEGAEGVLDQLRA